MRRKPVVTASPGAASVSPVPPVWSVPSVRSMLSVPSVPPSSRGAAVTGRPSAADERLGEADDLCLTRGRQLGDGLLLVAHERLLEEHALFVPAAEPALDDLWPRCLGLALGLGDVEQRLTLLVDDRRRYLVAAEVLRLRERDVHGDVVGELGGTALQHDDHAIDAAALLPVEVGVDHLTLGDLELDHAAHLDVLLERDLEVVDGVLVVVDAGLDGDGTLGVLAPGAIVGLGEALLAQDLSRLLDVAVGFLERVPGVHHAGAGGLA